jgi:hypothetical protein
MDELDKAVVKLGRTLRRLALYVGFFAVRVSSLASDTCVTTIPKRLVPLKRRKFSNN